MILDGKILEDDKELSEYGITAAAAHNLTIKLFLVDDFSPKPIKIEGPRKDSSGRCVIRHSTFLDPFPDLWQHFSDRFLMYSAAGQICSYICAHVLTNS